MLVRPPRLPKGLVCLVLACAVLATQTAGVGFCQGDPDDPPTTRAHFHVGFLLPQPAACGHYHLDEDEDSPAAWAAPPADHDADAFYVSADAGPRADNSVVADPDRAVLSLDPVCDLSRTAGPSRSEPDPGPSPPHCPTYLRYLALRL